MDSKRSKRSKNWSNDEKSDLVDFIRPRIGSIEDKICNQNNNKKKANAWENVHKEFCAKYGDVRTVSQIKEQWKALKIQAKKSYSNYKNELKATGGGPPPPEPKQFDQDIKDLIPNEFEELVNPFDDDADSIDIDASSTCTIR